MGKKSTEDRILPEVSSSDGRLEHRFKLAVCSPIDLANAIRAMLCRSETLVDYARSLHGILLGGRRPTYGEYRAIYQGTSDFHSDYNPELIFTLEALRYWWEERSKIDIALNRFDYSLVNDESKPPIEWWTNKLVRLVDSYTREIVDTRSSGQFKGEVDLPRFVEKVAKKQFPPCNWPTIEQALQGAAEELNTLISGEMAGQPDTELKMKRPKPKTLEIIREIQAEKDNDEVVEAVEGATVGNVRTIRCRLKNGEYTI
jgi:hypothetical protein